MGSHQIFAARKFSAPTSPQTFTYVGDDDAAGLFYFLGRNKGIASWTNPHTAMYMTVILEDNIIGDPITDAYTLVNRVADAAYASANFVGHWFAFDIGVGNSLTISDYWMKQRSDTSTQAMRNWDLEGSNDVATSDITGVNAATWTNLESRINDTTMPISTGSTGRYTVGGSPSAYRFFRIISTGVNANPPDIAMQVCEFEMYGVLTF